LSLPGIRQLRLIEQGIRKRIIRKPVPTLMKQLKDNSGYSGKVIKNGRRGGTLSTGS
jgi:hypothetical protein